MLLAATLLLGACDKEFAEIDESKINKNISAQDRILIDANNELSISLLRASFENNDTANFFFSPVSTGMALGMLYNGVGETEKESIVSFAGYESLELMEINKSYNQLLNFLALKGGKLQLTCANSMWFSSDMPINEDYRSTMMAYYDAEISEINFAKKTSLQYINNWVHFKTNGLFSSLIATPPAQNSRIVMVNAFGLNTSWTNGSYFNGSGSFSLWNGKKAIIPTVNLSNTYAGISNEMGLQFLEFGLKDENLRFSTIQLQSSEILESLLENLTPTRLDNLAKNARYAFTNLSLPEIPTAEKISLKSVLSSYGLSSVFAEGADLAPSFNSANRSVSAMEQTAMLQFSQPELHTTEFTNPDLQLKSLNLPFLYFITEKQTGAILFAGYYLSPIE
jgi:serine protease inhibitor